DDELELLERARAGLAPKCHRLAVEAAEGAVLLLAPPAAARGFEEQAWLPGALEACGVEFGEEVVEVRVGERVHVPYRRRVVEGAKQELALDRVACLHPVEAGERRALED